MGDKNEFRTEFAQHKQAKVCIRVMVVFLETLDVFLLDELSYDKFLKRRCIHRPIPACAIAVYQCNTQLDFLLMKDKDRIVGYILVTNSPACLPEHFQIRLDLFPKPEIFSVAHFRWQYSVHSRQSTISSRKLESSNLSMNHQSFFFSKATFSTCAV